MKRSEIAYLEHWFNKKTRMPLIIRGARQVGKSTLVKLFAEKNKIDLIEINLEKQKLKSLYSDNFQIENLIKEIELLSKKNVSSKSLIFFDEIQDEPKLIQMLRYFYEEKSEIPIVSAGSLLEIAIKNEKFSFPVGRVEFMHLSPMGFFDFLEATGENILKERIASLQIDDSVHNLAIEHYKKYLYIGGMPKAILTYITEKSLLNVREVQSQIVQTYMADFPKYNSRIDYKRISRIFQNAPQLVGKKIVYQSFDRESKARDVRNVLEYLQDARVILPCYHTEASGVPLTATLSYDVYKPYIVDVGILSSMLKIDFQTIDENLDNFIAKGALAEEFVAQHLNGIYGNSNMPSLCYWLRDKGSQKGEIDFFIETKNKIIPVEVKASATGKLKSLFHFAKDKKIKTAIKLSLDQYKSEKFTHIIADKSIEVEIISLPIYAVEAILKSV